MRIHRPVAALLLAAQVGCAGQRVLQSPASELSSTRLTRIWVTQSDGAEIELDGARLSNDTIYGLDKAGRDYALALRHAELVKVREISMKKTAMFAVGLMGVAALGMLLRGGSGIPKISSTDCDKRPDQPECVR